MNVISVLFQLKFADLYLIQLDHINRVITFIFNTILYTKVMISICNRLINNHP